jgi:DNA helicase-2/ATP-dependent DNA helicase PcrA
LTRVRDTAARWGAESERWVDKPEKGDPNPLLEQVVALPWPVEAHHAEIERRVTAAEAVRISAAEVDDCSPDLGLDLVETARVDDWDADIDRLLEEARTSRRHDIVVPLPDSLSATALKDLRDDPDQFARQVARPLPRRPSPSARFGTKFHAWVEARFGQQQMLDPDELPGRADSEVDSEADLADLIKAFEAGPFGDRAPSHIEPPFALVLDGQVVRGRIDAVYRTADGRYQVVDWKTNKAATADPLQLALYRVAWAELMGVPVEQVRAAFYYVRTGELVEFDDLPDRAELEQLVRGTAPE